MGGSVKKRIHVGDKVDCIYTKGMDTGEFSVTVRKGGKYDGCTCKWCPKVKEMTAVISAIQSPSGYAVLIVTDLVGALHEIPVKYLVDELVLVTRACPDWEV